MRAKRFWTIQSFFTVLFWNAILVAIFFYVTRQVIAGLHLWVDPFLGVGTESLSEEVRSAFNGMNQFLTLMQRYMTPAIFGVGGLGTLVLWLFILFQGRALVNRAQREIIPQGRPDGNKKAEKPVEHEAGTFIEPQYIQTSPQAAVQMLAVLQREGRLIDFLEEDLSLYEDAQIGAAVRTIHQGCKKALAEYVELKPILQENEGSSVTITPGFDSKAIRLTGNVAGDPPFSGTLRHRGWKVTKVELPRPTAEQHQDWVLTPAEVEI